MGVVVVLISLIAGGWSLQLFAKGFGRLDVFIVLATTLGNDGHLVMN